MEQVQQGLWCEIFSPLDLLGKGIPKQLLVRPMAVQESPVTLKDHSFLVGQLTSQTLVLEDRNAHIEAHFCYITNGLIYDSNDLICFTLHLHMYLQGLQNSFF